ncbi:GNAT family N-acetyltransferase [Tenacibaculum tangerinum]|uniref:GNAT family N-acetyltransferase n=1 Tax=Tenacibaculum tangerinum TaxID=3038772 RepID=A0ABY8L3P7_9FLAO|nr:GNAT family N-acetyltransferase [Tenacibaculum tangerinum]WGH76061.1 GNAT family N-acetyltransferase [Tenacibaculum tangerinum]
MQVKQEDNGKKGEFFVEKENKKVAMMTYTWAEDDKIIIDHTEVAPSLRGKGIGEELVEASINFARNKNIKIVPLCPFVKSVIDATPEYSDVLM